MAPTAFSLLPGFVQTYGNNNPTYLLMERWARLADNGLLTPSEAQSALHLVGSLVRNVGSNNPTRMFFDVLIALILSPPETFTPASLPAGVLVAWHSARSAAEVGGVVDGAAVSGWTDKSVTADPALSTGSSRPTYNAPQKGGRPRVRFDGAQQFMLGAVNRTATHALWAGRVRWPEAPRGTGDLKLFVGSNTFPGVVGLNSVSGPRSSK